MTAQQRDLARHALGLPNKQRISYRNHFVTHKDSEDYCPWQELVRHGLAMFMHGGEMAGGGDIFWLTQQGAEHVLEPGEKLKVDFSPKQVVNTGV